MRNYRAIFCLLLTFLSSYKVPEASADQRRHHAFGYGYHRCMILCTTLHPFDYDGCDGLCGIGVPARDCLPSVSLTDDEDASIEELIDQLSQLESKDLQTEPFKQGIE